jgi:O-methyltransferase domain
MALLRLASSYQVARAVYVAAQLGLADQLGGGPKTAEELARQTGTHAPSLNRLLRVLAACGVFREVAPGQVALTALGACLHADAPNSVRDAVLMFRSEIFVRSWGDLLHCVQTGESAASHLFGTPNVFDYSAQHPEVRAMMHAGFVATGRIAAHAVVAAYDFSAGGTLVDVGGGQGQLLATILRAYPPLHGVLFDQPPVVAGAAPVLERAGVAERCTVVAGDFFAEVPRGDDTYLLSRVIHDWEDADARAILATCHRAMPPQTTLLLVERVLPDHIDPAVTVQEQTLADLLMLVRTGGQERTEGEYRALFEATGFALARLIPTPTTYSVVQGVRRA